MYLRVAPGDGRSPSVEVLGFEDLQELRVDLDDVDPGVADRALASDGLGRIEGAHAWLDVVELRRRGPAASPGWLAAFDATMAYAATKGWTRADGTQVRAHLSRGAQDTGAP